MKTRWKQNRARCLGAFNGDSIDELDTVVSATCTRVPVVDGHLVNISVELADQPALSAIIADWETLSVACARARPAQRARLPAAILESD